MAILVVKLSALGDVVQTLPALKVIKAHLPMERVCWVVEAPYKDLLLGHPEVDKIIAPPKGFLKSPLELAKLFKELRHERYRLIIDYQGLLKSGIICGMAKGDYKLGFANHREGSPLFYTHRLPPYDPDNHAVLRYLTLTRLALKLLDINLPLDFRDLKDVPRGIFLPEERLRWVSFPYFVLVPSARWKTKEWPLKHWEVLIEKLLLKFPKHSIYIVGSGELKAWSEGVSQRFSRTFSLFDRLNLKELVYVIKHSSAVITVDTGPMHIASALDKTIVALFGPTSPKRTGPWSSTFKVLKIDLPCSPCFKKNCLDNLCMKKLSPEMVLSAIANLTI